MAHVRTLAAFPQLAIHDVTCRAARGGPGQLRGGEATHLVFVRRGAFVAHLARRAYVADPCTALLSWAETEYRLSHPGVHGDDCTVFELSPALADELLHGRHARRDFELPLSPSVQARYALALTTAQHGDALATEEVALELARAALGERPDVVGPREPRRALVRRARELLDADPTSSSSVGEIASAVGVSSHHLMRVFRHETGTTLRAYRVQLRLALALHRLRAGERDISALAAELGFASHAHLTDTFKRLLGTSPREFRARL